MSLLPNNQFPRLPILDLNLISSPQSFPNQQVWKTVQEGKSRNEFGKVEANETEKLQRQVESLRHQVQKKSQALRGKNQLIRQLLTLFSSLGKNCFQAEKCNGQRSPRDRNLHETPSSPIFISQVEKQLYYKNLVKNRKISSEQQQMGLKNKEMGLNLLLQTIESREKQHQKNILRLFQNHSQQMANLEQKVLILENYTLHKNDFGIQNDKDLREDVRSTRFPLPNMPQKMPESPSDTNDTFDSRQPPMRVLKKLTRGSLQQIDRRKMQSCLKSSPLEGNNFCKMPPCFGSSTSMPNSVEVRQVDSFLTKIYEDEESR